MGAGTEVLEGKNEQAICIAMGSIICGVIGFFIFGFGFGLAGAILGCAAIKQGSKLGYIGLVFGTLIFMLSIL